MVRFDPSVFRFRPGGRDSEQHHGFRFDIDGIKRDVDVRHELFVVGEEVVRREQRHDRLRRSFRDTQQGIKNRRRCSLVRWLFEQEISRDFVREWLVEPAVLLRDDDKSLTRCHGSGYPPPGLIKQAAPANHGYELFGTIVTCYSARHRLQPRTISTS